MDAVTGQNQTTMGLNPAQQQQSESRSRMSAADEKRRATRKLRDSSEYERIFDFLRKLRKL